MLVARGGLDDPRCEYRFHFGLERSFRLFMVRRRAMRWDTRYLPVREADSPGHAVLYVVGSGVLQLPAQGRDVGPAEALLADEAFFEGRGGVAPARLVGQGDPFFGFELQVEHASLEPAPSVQSASPYRTLGLAAETLRCADEAFAAFESGDPAPAVTRLLAALERDGVLIAGFNRGVTAEEPPRIARTWAALQALFAELEASPTLQEIADACGTSLRQIARDLEEITGTFTIGVEAFRAQRGLLRLRLAAMLLSVPGVSVGEVAQLTGYGSTTALDRAFRDAKLPPPSSVEKAG